MRFLSKFRYNRARSAAARYFTNTAVIVPEQIWEFRCNGLPATIPSLRYFRPQLPHQQDARFARANPRSIDIAFASIRYP